MIFPLNKSIKFGTYFHYLCSFLANISIYLNVYICTYVFARLRTRTYITFVKKHPRTTPHQYTYQLAFCKDCISKFCARMFQLDSHQDDLGFFRAMCKLLQKYQKMIEGSRKKPLCCLESNYRFVSNNFSQFHLSFILYYPVEIIWRNVVFSTVSPLYISMSPYLCVWVSSSLYI